MKLDVIVEFSEEEKESLRIVHDIFGTIDSNMGSMDVVKDLYGNSFSGEEIEKFEELLDSLKDEGIKIREEEK